MHDLDRVQLETERQHREETALDDLASELLEISDDAELDEFLGRVLGGATSAARRFARSDTGRALGGIARTAARQALPVIGRGVGGLISPDAARGGETMGRGLGQALGLELDGLSPQDQQFEAARAYIRWARTAAQTANRLASELPPRAAAQRAAVMAARRHAPGLAGVVTASTRRGQGRWVRRGDAIVLLDT